ncbi:MAG TPA: acyl-CoA acyltransferase [Xanthobacteraceae bacterium]|nr:acyl-CoA acyltransferase [Xanthobacteraceae bacterium]
MSSTLPDIRCRQIEEADVPAVAELLTRGFPSRGGEFWRHALDQLARHEPPDGLPKYGYLLESSNAPVGVLLLICAAMPADGAFAPRCNLSSWYVEPAFRAYAPMLVSQALRHKQVTYTNVSAAPHTWPIIEAQGFHRYSDGIFVALPALAFGGEEADVFDARCEPSVSFDRFDRETLANHAAHGCISLWCESAGQAYPFVFRPRLVKGCVPCAQLIYCRDIADFGRFAGPLGRYLARRGRPVVIVDANAPIPGLVGVFRRGSKPKYYKGPQRPRLGDLAYTEYAILGV